MNILCFSLSFIHTRFENQCVKVCGRLCYETICKLCFVFCFACLFETSRSEGVSPGKILTGWRCLKLSNLALMIYTAWIDNNEVNINRTR